MKKLIIKSFAFTFSFSLLLFFALLTNAQSSSGPYYSSTPGIGVVTNGGINTTLGTNFSVSIPTFTNYWWSSITITGCTFFPYLNTNWYLNTTLNCWTNHSGTNYILIDTNSSFFSIMSALSSPNGIQNVLEVDQEGSPYLPVGFQQWSKNDGVTMDTTVIIATNYWSVGLINFGTLSFGTSQQTYSYYPLVDSGGEADYVIGYSAYDSQNNEFWNLSEENDGSSLVAVLNSYSKVLGAPEGIQQNAGRLKFYGPNNNTFLGGFNIKTDNTYTNGANAFFELRGFGTGATPNTARPIYMDGGNGGVGLGNGSGAFNQGIDGSILLPHIPAWVEIFAGTAAKPQMVFEGTPTYTGVSTNGMIYSDGTNMWVTQRGQTGRLLTESGGNGSGLTNGFQNAVTYTNFLLGSYFTNITTRSELVSVSARCNPTTTVTALFGLVTSTTGVLYITNGIAGLEADTIFTTAPHGWYQLTAIVPSGGIWQVVDISGGGAVTVTNSYYRTLE